MIRVHRPAIARHLTPAQRSQLAQRQTLANGYGPRDARIDSAWESFRRSSVGRAVYRELSVIFRSKCAFCERINAKTADHFYPRKRYPRQMFRWSNLLWCCAECNTAKGDYFPFVKRRPLLIDPSREDPLDYFAWDLTTGAMVESGDPISRHRARETRDRLKLDEGPLRDERRAQLKRVLYLLAEVVNQHVIPSETQERLAEEQHRSRPYLGIICFLFREPNAYRLLVDNARAKLPEIDTWTAEWL